MRFLLDTNIISNVTKPAPSDALLAWMADQSDQDLYISSLTVAEIQRGVLETPAGKRRQQLQAWFAGPEGPQALFAGRVLPFDEKAGLVWAKLMADGKARGRPRSALDTIIAAVADANECARVTTRFHRGYATCKSRHDGTGAPQQTRLDKQCQVGFCF